MKKRMFWHALKVVWLVFIFLIDLKMIFKRRNEQFSGTLVKSISLWTISILCGKDVSYFYLVLHFVQTEIAFPLELQALYFVMSLVIYYSGGGTMNKNKNVCLLACILIKEILTLGDKIGSLVLLLLSTSKTKFSMQY